VIRRSFHEQDDEQEVTCVCAGGHDYWEVVGLSQGSVQDDVIIHILGAVVADEAHEADLVVDDEQRGIVPINSLELVCSN